MRKHATRLAVGGLLVVGAGCGGAVTLDETPGAQPDSSLSGGGGSSGAGGTSGAGAAGGIDASGGAGASGSVGGASGSAGADAGASAEGGSPDAGADADGGMDDGDAHADSAPDAPDASPIKCPAGVVGHCTPPDGGYPAYPGFTLVLVEDFGEPIDMVSDPVWTYSDGFGDNRYTRYVKEAITFTGGNAVITATGDGVVNTGYPTYAESVLNAIPSVVTGTTTVRSGELRTKYNNYRYGRCELRMKAPRNSNVIASLWTFRTPKWQDWRETRVEITPANAPNAAGTNIIWGQNAPAYGNTSNSYSAKTVTTLAAGATIYDDFHTYAVQMTPTQVTWWADGVVIRTETGAGVKLPDLSMKLLINLWVFPSGGWGGAGGPGANVYPMHSETDWIRFYKWDQEPTYPCSPTPSCLPVDDRDYAKNNAEDGVAAAAPW